MSKLTKFLFLLSFLFFAFGQAKAHSVQVGYCVNCAGDLRVWVEHWHNAANPNTTTMTIQVQVGQNVINVNGSPDTSVLGVPIGQLPGCFTPLNVFAQCQGTGIYAPNTHNDWVAYDFPGLQCGVPINITVISGNSAFTDDCGNPVNMFPASSGQFTIPCSTNQLPDDTVCSGAQAGPYNFPVGNAWTNDNPAIGLPASGTGDVGPFTAANVTVPTTGNITVNNTCGVETFAITVLPGPIADFTAQVGCPGQPVNFTNNSTTNGPGPFTHTWDFGDNSPVFVGVTPPPHNYTGPGPFNVTLTITTPGGCDDDTTIVVDPLSGAVANFVAPSVCEGDITSFTDLSTPTGNILSWAWDFDNNGTVDDINQNPTFNFGTAGTYNVKLVVQVVGGCSDSIVIPVVVNPLPTANFSIGTACFGFPNTFNDLSTGNVTEWFWDFGDLSTLADTSLLQNPTYTYPAIGTYAVNLTVTTDSGCTDTYTSNITTTNPLVANFDIDTVCFGDATSFTDSSTTTSGNIISWNWDFGDAFGTSNVQNPTYTYVNAGVYPVTLTVTTDSGCVSTYIDSAYVYFSPTAGFTTNNVCLNQAANFIDTSNPNGGVISSWSWDFDNNGIVDANSQNASNNFPTHGTYNVQLIVGISSGCSDTIVQPIEIYPMPTADFNFNNECHGTPIAFTDASVVATGAVNGWDWDFGNGNTSMVQNPSENYAVDGIYSVQLITTTDNGCKDTVIKQVEVYPTPIANFGPQDVCLNNPTMFYDSTTVNNTNNPNNIVSWTWDFGDGLGISNVQNPVYSYGNEGTYPVMLTVVSNNGCTHDTTIDVIVHPLPVVDFEGPAIGCSPVCVTFINNSNITVGNIATWAWDFGDGSISGDMAPTHCFVNESHASVANFDVTLTATSDKGCVTTLTQPSLITSYPIPKADFTFGPQPTDIYNSEILFSDQSVIGSSWDWDFGDGGTSSEQSPLHEYADSGSYVVSLYMENIYGCRDTATKTVKIDPTFAIWIPNVFTPDGDGVNDLFFVDGYGIEQLQTLIFDRWGALVYEGYQLDSKWNGTYKGKMSVQDVYVYRVKARDVFGEWHEFVGRVTLLK